MFWLFLLALIIYPPLALVMLLIAVAFKIFS